MNRFHKHKQYKRKKRWFWIPILLIAALIAGDCSPLGGHLLMQRASIIRASAGVEPVVLKQASGKSVKISASALNSPHAILVDVSDQTILMQKNSGDKIYPASMTKMMTAIVALENLPNLHEKITLSPSIFSPLQKQDASMAGFSPNEKVRTVDLLYGALLPSGAECCLGLAQRVAGTESDFVKLMNRKAAQLGMKHTHFANTTGLQNSNHYTTVKDLSILLCYALKNSTFRQIFTTAHYTSAATSEHPEGISFSSTLFQSLPDATVPGGKILGGKTGFTDEAGLCLASLAEKDGRDYICVTSGAKGTHSTSPNHIKDACTVFKSF